MRRSIWAEDGRIEASVLIAVDGVTVDTRRLDAPLAPSGGVAEVSVFLVRSTLASLSRISYPRGTVERLTRVVLSSTVRVAL